jgi:hypothetical protein
MSTLNDRINDFDYDTASISDLAVLLEQVYMYADARARNGGPIIVAQGVLTKWGDAIRRRAAPELHDKVKGRCAELRSTVDQLGTLLGRLEKDNAKAGS